jgi:hypothetical protein
MAVEDAALDGGGLSKGTGLEGTSVVPVSAELGR